MSSSLFTPIDAYCERLGPGFWAEPVNALSNASFVLAAWLAWRLARREGATHSIEVRVLVALMLAIGLGSFLFHTVAVTWAMLADVIPIYLYQLLFLVFYLRRVAGLRAAWVVLWLAAFLALAMGFGALPGRWLNGSLSYASAALFVAGMGVHHWRTGRRAPLALLAASGVFVLSLSFRSLDSALCAHLPLGTHVMWHLLNGVVLYLSTHAFIANVPGRTPR